MTKFEEWHNENYADETRIANKFIREEAWNAALEALKEG